MIKLNHGVVDKWMQIMKNLFETKGTVYWKKWDKQNPQLVCLFWQEQ